MYFKLCTFKNLFTIIDRNYSSVAKRNQLDTISDNYLSSLALRTQLQSVSLIVISIILSHQCTQLFFLWHTYNKKKKKKTSNVSDNFYKSGFLNKK